MRRLLLAASCLTLLAGGAAAQNVGSTLQGGAGRSAGPAPAPPTLANVTIPFGNLTQTNKGQVFIRDLPGFVVTQGNSGITSWSAVCVSSNCGDLTAYSGAEGASAILPVPAAAGVADCLQGGVLCATPNTYVINYTATSAAGTSNTGVLTIITTPGHATLGNEAGVPQGATFQAKGGVAIDFAVGSDRGEWSGSNLSGTATPGQNSARTILGAAFTGNNGDCSITATAMLCSGVAGTGAGFAAGQYIGGYTVQPWSKIVSCSDATHCVVTPSQAVATTKIHTGVAYGNADDARPTPVIDIEQLTSSSYMIFEPMSARRTSGNQLPSTILTTGSGSSWTTVNGWTVQFSPGTSSAVNDTSAAFQCNNTTDVAVNNLLTDYAPQGVQEAGATPCSRVTFKNTIIAHASDNFLFMGSGVDWNFYDTYLVSPCGHAGSSLHVDQIQITDGAGQTRPKFHRLFAIDGAACQVNDNLGHPLGNQAPIFSNQSPWVVTASQDNGSGAPGNILHVTAVQDHLASPIVSSPLALTGSPHVTAFPAGGTDTGGAVSGSNGILTVGTLSGGALLTQGMSVTGVNWGTGILCNLGTNISGANSGSSTGSTWNVVGCSAKSGNLVYSASQGEGVGDYTVSGSPQLFTSTTVHTIYNNGGDYDGVIYVGCATSGPNFFSAVDSNFKHFTNFHANLAGYPVAACATTGPGVLFNLPTHNGTGRPYDGANTLTDSYFSGTLSTLPASFTTARNYFANGANGTTDPACGGVCDFVNTTPKATLEAFNWSAATVAQQVAEIVAVLKPSGAVGSNTNQGGTIIGALTTSGLWNDGSGIAP